MQALPAINNRRFLCLTAMNRTAVKFVTMFSTQGTLILLVTKYSSQHISDVRIVPLDVISLSKLMIQRKCTSAATAIGTHKAVSSRRGYSLRELIFADYDLFFLTGRVVFVATVGSGVVATATGCSDGVATRFKAGALPATNFANTARRISADTVSCLAASAA